ncbi:hypothetical protein ACUOBA_49970, partial [Escherichia coli]
GNSGGGQRMNQWKDICKIDDILPETGKLQAPAVILPLLSKIAVYLYSKSCFGLLTPHLIN